MSDSPFAADFRALLTKHGITAPKFAHGARDFDPARPQVLYSGPVYDQEELVAATSALVEGRWSVAGEYVYRFEREFASYLKQRAAVMVNSGSSADLLMVAAAKKRFGWKDGDGIIVSAVGFPTTVSAITLNGLIPVFVDIEWETLNADNDAIEAVLEEYQRRYQPSTDGPYPGHGIYVGPYIRAIFVSPVLGNPPDIDRLTALAAKYGVALLMDGCDSLGTTWCGKHLAEYATATSCSFFPSHHISTLQGGMISSNDAELVAIARQMSQWGRACWCVGPANLLPNGSCGCRFREWLPDEPDLVLDHKYIYETDRAYNLQPLDLQGALGLEQMKKLPFIHTARRAAYDRVHTALNPLRSSKLGKPSHAIDEVDEVGYASPSWFGVPVICPTYTYKTALVAHLEAAGIQTRNMFAGNILAQPGYAHLGRAADFPNAQEVLKRVFFLGANPSWGDAHFGHIEATIKAFVPPTP